MLHNNLLGSIRSFAYKILGFNIASCFHKIFRFLFYSKKHALTDADLYLVNWLSGVLTPGDIAIDIGAHNVSWSLLLSKLMGPNGLLYAYEPVPENFNILVNVTSKLSNVVCRDTALSNVSGPAYFRVPRDTFRPSTGSLDGSATVASSSLFKKILVARDTLDRNLLPELRSSHVSIIKCDVEGHEAAVLQGAKDIIFKHRPIVVLEILREKWIDSSAAQSKAAQILLTQNYSIYQVTKSGLIDNPTAFTQKCEDFLFLPLSY